MILTGASIPANGSCTVKVDVTANNAGSYINSLPIGALQTSNGSNNAPAVATLTVIPTIPPTLSKSLARPPSGGRVLDPHHHFGQPWRVGH